ncbi:putative protease [Ruminococcaceae bacterium YRB3002]|nr:putative protease [Ruminococcaceae bacterium YRB3002]
MSSDMRVEVLSPAGDMEKLKTVIAYGADAVYMSGKSFGLRTFSGNFTHDEMVEGIAYAHAHGVKCYVTLNILAVEEDLQYLDDEIDFVAHEAKADAVLVSDPGIFARVRKVAPDLEIHISTQASVTNSGACTFWQEQGASRIVLAREVSLAQIREIRKSIDPSLQLECFVHGAMCVAYSGRCLLSNYFTGRRSNGGACAQPCRWGYSVVEEKRPDLIMPLEEDARGTYIFGSKDICMVEHVPEMIESGINSLKIEGRIKGAYYAACATKVYREAVDTYYRDPSSYKADPRWLELLDKVVHRDYDTGFFYHSPSEDAKIDSSKSYNKPAFVVGVVSGVEETTGLVRVTQKNKFYSGDVLNVLMPSGYVDPVTVLEMYDDKHNPIDSCPHPEMTVYVKLSCGNLPELSFLSRDGDKDYGINKM